MDPELQKPQVTELQVRMDCNGCLQKIKKSLIGINGIYDLYIDFPEQKLTVIGWADPEKIIKAIRRTRKIATICSRIESAESPSQSPEPAPDATQQLPATEAPPAQAAPLAEPHRDTPTPEQPPEATALSTMTENSAHQLSQSTPGTKDVGDVHAMYEHIPNYGNRYGSGHSYVGEWDRCQSNPVLLQEPPPPIYVTHSYNTYKPSPYVTEYEYVRSPKNVHYNRNSGDYNDGYGNFTCMFSDENPNACRIV